MQVSLQQTDCFDVPKEMLAVNLLYSLQDWRFTCECHSELLKGVVVDAHVEFMAAAAKLLRTKLHCESDSLLALDGEHLK